MSQGLGGQPRRQHFVPRLLLKGFAHRVRGKEYYVFEFHRGANPREVNITNVAVARDFYGHPEKSDLERKLSLKESQHASLVHELLDGRISPDQDAQIADFVTHLIVRTKNIRDGFIDMGLGVFDSFERVISKKEDRAKIENKMIRDLLEHPTLRPLLTLIPEPLRREVLMRSLAEQGLNPIPAFQELLRLARANIDVAGIAQSAQLRALEMEDALLERINSLKYLRWTIIEAKEEAFVLGDIGPVARFSESPALQSPLKFTTPAAIFLPVSKQRLLVGQTDRVAGEVEVRTVNMASVELSRDLFVAGTNTERELHYSQHIGRRAAFLDEPEMDAGLRQAFE